MRDGSWADLAVRVARARSGALGAACENLTREQRPFLQQ